MVISLKAGDHFYYPQYYIEVTKEIESTLAFLALHCVVF